MSAEIVLARGRMIRLGHARLLEAREQQLFDTVTLACRLGDKDAALCAINDYRAERAAGRHGR